MEKQYIFWFYIIPNIQQMYFRLLIVVDVCVGGWICVNCMFCISGVFCLLAVNLLIFDASWNGY